MKKLYYLTIALSLVLFSCGGGDGGDEGESDVDSQAPTMTIVKPTEGQEFTRGEFVKLTGDFKDDMALKQITVSITEVATKSTTGITDPWTPADDVVSLSGKEQRLIDYQLFGEAIETDCKPGAYKLTFTLEDAAGKTSMKEVNITIL